MPTWYKGKRVPDSFTLDAAETDPADGLLTVAEHLHRINREEMDISPRGLFKFVQELVATVTEYPNPVRIARLMTDRWGQSLRLVIDQCRAWGVNPKAYAVAQMDMMACIARKRRYVYDSIFLGDSALKRYRTWARGPEHRYADANRYAHPARDALLPAELVFAESYLGGKTLAEAKEAATERNPRWTLQAGKRDLWLRLTAVSHFLSALDLKLPDRILLKRLDWKWKELRRELRPLVRAGDAAG